MALISLRRQVQKDSAQALVKWRAACAEQASPDNSKAIDPASVIAWGEALGIEEAVSAFEADVASIEKVERLEVAVRMLDEEIERTLKPWKTREALAAAITKAEEELKRLRSVEGELFGIDCTRGYERSAAAKARLDCERIYGVNR